MDAEISLTQAFGEVRHRVTDIAGLIKALNAWYLCWTDHQFLHPCVIDGRPALVCRAELSRIAPEAFAELAVIAERHGLYLKQDSRRSDNGHEHPHCRRGAGLVLSFCIGLLAASRTVSADAWQAAPVAVSVAGGLQTPVGELVASGATDGGAPVIRLRRAGPPSTEQVLSAYQTPEVGRAIDSGARSMVADFLRDSYRAEAGDPATVDADLAAMADYYAGHPRAVELIQSLQGRKLSLKYRQGTWQAQAWGNQYGVDSVTIYFDTRLGAQLLDAPGCEANPACAISPADALLHELLHAKLMLLDSARFIADGGMAGGLYPFQHEHEVLNLENQLYRAMNVEDGQSRPIRHRHVGVLLEVACPACAPGVVLAGNTAD